MTETPIGATLDLLESCFIQALFQFCDLLFLYIAVQQACRLVFRLHCMALCKIDQRGNQIFLSARLSADINRAGAHMADRFQPKRFPDERRAARNTADFFRNFSVYTPNTASHRLSRDCTTPRIASKLSPCSRIRAASRTT